MDEQFSVPDWGVEDIIENSPEYYFSQWCELMKDGDCVIAIQRRKANAIGRAMFSHGFSNVDVHRTYNKARVACGLQPQVDFPAKTQPNKSVQRTTPTVPPCTCSMEDGIHEWNCAVEVARRSR